MPDSSTAEIGKAHALTVLVFGSQVGQLLVTKTKTPRRNDWSALEALVGDRMNHSFGTLP